MTIESSPVLVLGAGINGAAIARELALSGVPVWVVDQGDVACGATSRSSRLIHGGLRYLEYGDFALVRESLAERNRLLRLAPQFVRPLRLLIPVSQGFGGVRRSAARFLGLEGTHAQAHGKSRGLWLIRAGLSFYDWYARSAALPRSHVHDLADPGLVRVDPGRYRWLCSYYDAQVVYPERLVIALLTDAVEIAAQRGVHFEVFTYHRATLAGNTVAVRNPENEIVAQCRPSLIVNATGAWVDHTLDRLAVPSEPLMGGTKGSHFVTFHPALRAQLGTTGLYAEADDGRPIFILPFGEGALIGTTDIPFENDPGDVLATDEEIDYLLRTVNEVLSDVRLGRKDVDFRYCGVRPLPKAPESATAAITRRHQLVEHPEGPVRVISVVGGKLTTCRSLAEEAADTILKRLGRARTGDSRIRVIPGGESYPEDAAELISRQEALAARHGRDLREIEAVWALCGARADRILEEADRHFADRATLAGSALPRSYVRWVIHHEWVRNLDDLVERRLMLLYDPRLSAACLTELAQLLVEEGVARAAVAEQVDATVARLESHYRRRLATIPREGGENQ